MNKKTREQMRHKFACFDLFSRSVLKARGAFQETCAQRAIYHEVELDELLLLLWVLVERPEHLEEFCEAEVGPHLARR